MEAMVTVQLQVPERWMQDLKDQVTLLEILSLGLEEYRLQRALTLYQKGAGSLGYVAELVGIPKRVLMEEARRVTDQGARIPLYQQADRILMAEAAIMPLAYSRSHLLVKPWVSKFPACAIKNWFWKDVVVEARGRS